MVSDQDNEESGPSSSDLKARLGLNTKKRRATRAPKTAPQLPKASASDAQGTSEADFDPFGSQKTPLPQALPQPSQASPLVTGSDVVDIPGTSRVALKPVIVMLIVTMAVAGGLGVVLGGAMEQRGLRAAHADYAKEKLDLISAGKTKTGAELLPAIDAYATALSVAAKEFETFAAAKQPSEKNFEAALDAFIVALEAYVSEQAFLNPERLLDDVLVLYPKDENLAAVQFADKTRHLYRESAAALAEFKGYSTMAKGPFLALRRPKGEPVPDKANHTFLVQRGERDVEGIGKVPSATGVLVGATGKPRQVTQTERGKAKGTAWEIMAVELGKPNSEAVQVPTTDVVSVDLTPIYADHAKVVKRYQRGRITAVVGGLKALAKGLDWESVSAKLRTRAAGGAD